MFGYNPSSSVRSLERLGIAGATSVGDTTLNVGDLMGNDVMTLTSAAGLGHRALVLACALQMASSDDVIAADAMTGSTLPWTLDQYGFFFKATNPYPSGDFRPMDGSPDSQVVLQARSILGAPQFRVNSVGGVGEHGATPPTVAPIIIGSRAAMGVGVYLIIQALAAKGTVVDGTTA